MAIIFDIVNHRKLWLLMRDNIEDYIKLKYIPTFYDAEVTVDDLKAKIVLDGMLGVDYTGNIPPPLFYCFACQYGWETLCSIDNEADKKDRCVYCPLTGWEADKCFVKTQLGTLQEGLFHQLCVAVEEKEIETAKQLCERIANLDIKDGVLTHPEEESAKVTMKTIPGNSLIVIRRADNFYKMPVGVYVFDHDPNSRTYSRCINHEGILQVGYQEDRITIANEWDEEVRCVVIDADRKKYNSPLFQTLAAGRSFTVDRTNNFGVMPVTILVEDNCVDSRTYRHYVEHSPYFTMAQDDSTYTIYNETDENMNYVIMSAPVEASVSEQLIGANSSYSVTRPDSLTKTAPIVLVRDITTASKTYGKYVDSIGLETVSLSEQVIMIHNDTDISLSCKIIYPRDLV